MKPTKLNHTVLLLVLLTSFVSNIVAAPMGTAFTYQGRLASGTNAANGIYDFTFALFDVASGGTQNGSTLSTNGVPVTNGLFTATLDFGSVFDGNARWLAVWVKTNGAGIYTALTPRQPLTPAPYAVFAGSLSSNVNQTFTGTVSFSPSSGPPFTVGNSTKVVRLNADLLDGLDSTAFWKLGGNADTTVGVDFLGTVDHKPLELRANSTRALRLEQATDSVNVIGGYAYNAALGGAEGVTIGGGGGGGGALGSNTVAASFSTIGGGQNNRVEANDIGFDTIGGGGNNIIQNGAYSATIAGGFGNTVGTNAAQSAVGGGTLNAIGTNALRSTIAGGYSNVVFAQNSVIAGGNQNRMVPAAGASSESGRFNTISGGASNSISGFNPSALSLGDTIGGGGENGIASRSYYATIAGGYANGIFMDSHKSTIGGGERNYVDSGWSTISGGQANVIDSYSFNYSTIAGGSGNLISNAAYAAIGGGSGNSIVMDGVPGNGTVGGGSGNRVTGRYATVPGGSLNLAGAPYAFAAGNRAKANHQGAFVWADSTAADFISTDDNQFLIRASGGVGIANTNPATQLDVRGKASLGSGVTPSILNVSNILNLQVGASANGWANGIGFYEFSDNTFGMKLGYDGTGNGDDNKLVIYDSTSLPRFIFQNGGNLGLGVSNPDSPIKHSSGALLTVGGVWQNASDANRKTDFRQVNPGEVLARLARLPVQFWRYTNELSSVRHLGPTAQDFKAAFGLGTDDKSIGTVDTDGVALAAIQGLNQVVQEKDARIQALEKDVAELKGLVNTLVRNGNGGGQ